MIAILIKNDGSAEHIVQIEGIQCRVWEGTLPSGTPVDVVVQSIRPKPGSSDSEVETIRAELAQHLEGLKESNLERPSRAEYIHRYGEEPPWER